VLDDSGLLDLDGDLYVINEAGYWVKFEVKRTAITPERPHGIDYSITLHDPKNNRIAGFAMGMLSSEKGREYRLHTTISTGLKQLRPMNTGMPLN